jgi:hypothetical protein
MIKSEKTQPFCSSLDTSLHQRRHKCYLCWPLPQGLWITLSQHG